MKPHQFEPLELRTLLSVIHVDVNSPASSPTGATWETAYQDLQAALAAAASGDQIWVADGTYKPTSGMDRSISFRLNRVVQISGGYSGYGAPDPDHRDLAASPTILSGDIGAVGVKDDNTYNVIVVPDSVSAGSNIVMDGVTIVDGYANLYPASPYGAAVYVAGGSPNFIDCTFANNASLVGGARRSVFGPSSSIVTAVFTRCGFFANSCFPNDNGISTDGGAISIVVASASIDHCTFADNVSQSVGGAVSCALGSCDIANSTFIRNRASAGGAIFLEGSASSSITNCLFEANRAQGGGAIRVRDGGGFGGGPSSAKITNSCFVGNTASLGSGNKQGGAIYNVNSEVMVDNCALAANSAGTSGGAAFSNGGTFSLINSIVSGNSAPASSQLNSTISASYADVEGGFAGLGNIDADPQFVRNPSPGGDGVWGTVDDDYGDLRLQITSPCIDVGDNASVPNGVTTDLAGNPRFYDFPGVNDPGAIVDMGAHELNNHLGLLHVAANQTLVLPAGGNTFFIEQLQMDLNATLDVRDNDLIVDYFSASPLASIQSMINSGRTGNWSGIGITSTAARDNVKHNTTLGAMEAADYKSIYGANATFDGEAIDNTAVLIKYTYYGDANFNGKVDGADYSRIDATFNMEHSAGNIGGWINGDFNGDGKVDGADYGLIDGAFNSQGAPLRPSVIPTKQGPTLPGKPGNGGSAKR